MSKKKQPEFDFKKLKTIVKVTKKIITNNTFLTILALAIPIFLALFIRIQPMYLPVVDDWAERSVDNSLTNQASQQIELQYPNLPAERKNVLIQEQLATFKDSGEYQTQISSVSTYFKSRLRYVDDDPSTTYLGDLDSYYYARYARNLLEKGSVCDEQINNTCRDTLMLAPYGMPAKKYGNIHPYSIVYTHKFLSIFNKEQQIWNSAFWVQIIFGMLSVIPAFFLTRRITNNFGGLIAGLLIATSPMFLSRSLGSDTGLYHIISPLLIIWFFFEAFDTKSFKKKITFTILAGVSTGLASFMWGVWWYFFDVILLAAIGYVIYFLLKLAITKTFIKAIKNKQFIEHLFVLLGFIIVSGIAVSAIYGIDKFIQDPTSPLRITTLLDAAKPDLWPNVYTTVAELHPGSITNAINSLGGKLLFFISALGAVMTLFARRLRKKDYIILGTSTIYFLLLISQKALTLSPILYALLFSLPILVTSLLYLKDKRSDTKYAFLILIWYAVSFYTLTQGVRFVILLVPPFAIATGVFFGNLIDILPKWLNSFVARPWAILATIVLTFMILQPVMSAGLRTGESYTPSISDAWVETLEKIGEESNKTAIINSWWDFGHWFKYWADRGVTADGASQNTPRSHWLGLALQSENEKVSVGTLRMLVCSSNRAFEELNKQYDDTEITHDILMEVLPLNREEAKIMLENKEVNNVDTILNLIKCENPPEDYFITSEDMVGKAGVWAHFGLWDFTKAWQYNNLKGITQASAIQQLMERYDQTQEEAIQDYTQVNILTSEQSANAWISPWPNYLTTNWRSCSTKDNLTICNLNIAVQNQGNQRLILDKAIINETITNSYIILTTIDTNTGAKLGSSTTKPNNIIMADDELIKYDLNASLEFDLVYDKKLNKALLASPELSQSMFTKLFFLEGRYTTNFEKFHDATTVHGSRILTWKVLFD